MGCRGVKSLGVGRSAWAAPPDVIRLLAIACISIYRFAH
jgi:hypothetical protein